MIGVLMPPADEPRVAWVDADVVDVLDEPDDAAFSTGRLSRGSRISVRREGPDGWLTINPPAGAFSLIEETALEDLGDGRARILTRLASVRPGREGARIPGPPHVVLKQGATVRLLDRRPLVVRQDGQSVTWIAIAPPRAEVRFVRADAVVDGPLGSDDDEPMRKDRLISSRVDSDLSRREAPVPPRNTLPAMDRMDARFASAEPEGPDPGLSREVSEAIARISANHQAILRGPMDRWNLSEVEAAYTKLLRGGLDPAEHRAIENRLDLVKRQAAAAAAAKKLDALIRTSCARDGRVAEARRGMTRDPKDASSEYDAEGLLQTSSRLVEGRRVHALLGNDGAVVAYLAIPPGLVVEPMLSHRVGVRGEGHYEESLRSRLILVRDMERLERRKTAGIRTEDRSPEPR